MGAAGVNGEQPPQSDVTRYLYGMRMEVLMGCAHLKSVPTNPEQKPEEKAGLRWGVSNQQRDRKMTMVMAGDGKVSVGVA